MSLIKSSEAKLKSHWLTLPLFFFVVFFLVYIYFFGSNGYFAYMNMLEYQEKLESRNQRLEEEKQMIQERLEELKNDSAALEVFTPVYFLYKDDVSVIKFLRVHEQAIKDDQEKKPYNIYFLQKTFITVVSGFMLVITFFFWYRKN